MTVATLGLAVNSSQVSQATPELLKLTAAAGQAEAAATRLAGATNIETVAQGKATAASRLHTAALHAEAAAMRMGNQVRTNMIFQLNDVGVSLASGMHPAMVAVQQLPQMLQFGLAPALKSVGDIATSVATKFWPVAVAVGAVTATFAGLTYEINKNAETQVSMIDVALAAWDMFADQVGAIVGPLWAWLVDGLAAAWDLMAPILKDMGNGIIRPFAFGIEAIGVLWQKLPAAIGDAMITTANVIVKGIEWSINGATRLLNGFLGKYNEGLAAMGQKPIPLAGGITIPQAANPFQGALGQLGQGLNGASLNANKTDFMGDMFGGLSERAQAIALARAETEDLGKAASTANDNFGKLVDQGLGDLTHWTESFGKAAQSAFSNLGSGIIDAFKKGGDIASNVLNMLMDKVGQFGETLLNNGLNGLLNAGLGALGGMFGGGQWGVAGGFSGFSGIFGIPGMAAGGTVGREGLSWVGEQGPELLRLPQGAQVIPNGPSLAANQNGAPQLNITNHMQVMPGATEEDGAAFARGVTKELRKQLPDAIQSYNRNPLRRAG
jgi:hypothetical protein